MQPDLDLQWPQRQLFDNDSQLKGYPLAPQILILMHQQQTAFENIVGKGEIARKEQFLLFPQCFLLNQMIVSPFVHIFHIISLKKFATEIEEHKIVISGKVVRPF